MNLPKKTINQVAWAILALCVVFGALFPKSASEALEDMTEATGFVCIVFLGLVMVLFLAYEMLKRKWYPTALKKAIVFVTRQLALFHVPLSIAGLGFLVIHVLVSGYEQGESGFHLFQGNATTTGLVFLVFALLSILAGLLVKRNRKLFRSLHIWLAILAVIPVLIHLID
jgi:uncharacterized membrane protein (DUF485 family)